MTAALPLLTLIVGVLVLAALPVLTVGYDRRLGRRAGAR